MKEKDLDNTYMSEVGDGQKRMSTEPVEVDNGLDSIIVSNVTQTLSGGLTISVSDAMSVLDGFVVPAGTPIIAMKNKDTGETEFSPCPIDDSLSMNLNVSYQMVGIVTHSFVYGKKPVSISVAKAAHVNVDALCDEMESSLSNFPSIGSLFDKKKYKKIYISGNWHYPFCLTFEQFVAD